MRHVKCIPSPVQTPKPDDAASQLHEFLGAGPAPRVDGRGHEHRFWHPGLPQTRWHPTGAADATREFVGSSGARQRYWARSFIGWQRFGGGPQRRSPRAGVSASARALGTIITQNVDGLHQRAGSPDVIELHGSLSRVVCLSHGTAVGRDALQQRMASENAGFERHSWGWRPTGPRSAARSGRTAISSWTRPPSRTFTVPCAVCRSDTLKTGCRLLRGQRPARSGRPVRRSHRPGTEPARPRPVARGDERGLRFVRQAARRGIPIATVTRGATRGDDLPPFALMLR